MRAAILWPLRPGVWMPPKNKKKGKAAAKPQPELREAEETDGNAMCAPQLIRVHEALKVIREHVVFEGIDDAKPLTVPQGGRASRVGCQSGRKGLEGHWRQV